MNITAQQIDGTTTFLHGIENRAVIRDHCIVGELIDGHVLIDDRLECTQTASVIIVVQDFDTVIVLIIDHWHIDVLLVRRVIGNVLVVAIIVTV